MPRDREKKQYKTCFIYTRVSTKMQVDNGESLEAQLHDLRAHAREDGIKILHEYQDAGFSGKNIQGRPGFTEMMNAVRSGVKVDVILVWKLSRFGRNTLDVLSAIKELARYGTAVYIDDRKLYSDDDMGTLLITVLSMVSEMERENILEQTYAGRVQKAREGFWNGGQAPYGYRIVKDERGKGHLVIEPDEADQVRLMFKMYTEGTGINSIAGWMNTHGYRREIRGNMKNDKFNPHFVKKVLDNPVYTGVIAYGRTRNVLIEGSDNEHHRVGQAEYDTFEGEHDAIVDQETWDKVAELRKESSRPFPRKSRNPDHVNILSGVLKCPVCGRSMTATGGGAKKKKDGSPGKPTWAYQCKYSSKNFGPDCTYKSQPNQEVVHAEVLAVVRQVLHSPMFRERLSEELDATSDIDKLKADVERIKKASKEVENERKNATRRQMALDPSDSLYEVKFEEMQEFIDEKWREAEVISKNLGEAYTKLDAAEQNRVTAANVYDLLDELENGFDDKSDEEKRQIIAQIVESVDIDPNAKRRGPWVTHIRFKVPVTFAPVRMDDEMQELFRSIGVDKFNEHTQQDWYSDNSRVKGNNVESVVLLDKQKSKPKDYVKVGLDTVEYDRIKEGK